jgi:two-component system, OmpR family, response regulator
MTSIIRVLCIDDEPDIRTIASIALGLDPDMDVRSAGSGGEALEMLDDRSWRPHVVLLDVMMPGMDGLMVLAALRSRPDTRALPVIFMTARARRADIDGYRELGALGAIVKPFDPVSLAADVRTMIDARQPISPAHP